MLETLEDRLAPATLMVNTNADNTTADNSLSLREAILLVNSGGNANTALSRSLTSGEAGQVSGAFGVTDTIEFSSALTSDTIDTGRAAQNAADAGSLKLSKSVTITGLGASNLAVNGNQNGGGIFLVDSGVQASITGLTLANGAVKSLPGSIGTGGIPQLGGGITNNGTLTVTNCTLSENTTGFAGGGVLNNGTLTVTNSTLSGNFGNLNGGGIANRGTLTVINSTLSGNDADNFGGGIDNQGGMLTVINSTLSGNSAAGGAGISSESGGHATLNNTIVANSTMGSDLSLDSGTGSTFAGSNDLIGDGSDSSSLTHVLQGNPLLGPLGNNGGPTQTLVLLPGSPAINAGSNALAVDAKGNALTTDQRGDPRIVGAAVDLGAVESQAVDELGAYRASNGSWSLDSDSTPGFNGATDQVFYSFSPPGVTGVAGDWTGSGTSKVGDFSNGTWHLDLAGTGAAPGANETFQFGQAGDQPVVGDWDGNTTGRDEIGVFRANPDGSGSGIFILDIANHHTLDSSCETFTFGLATDHIIVGDWNGSGTSKVGVYRDAASFIPADAGDAVFSINTNGDRATFTNFVFGLITDKVIIGDWNGGGQSEVGVYRDGSTAPVGNALHAPGTALFSLDTNGNSCSEDAASIRCFSTVWTATSSSPATGRRRHLCNRREHRRRSSRPMVKVPAACHR